MNLHLDALEAKNNSDRERIILYRTILQEGSKNMKGFLQKWSKFKDEEILSNLQKLKGDLDKINRKDESLTTLIDLFYHLTLSKDFNEKIRKLSLDKSLWKLISSGIHDEICFKMLEILAYISFDKKNFLKDLNNFSKTLLIISNDEQANAKARLASMSLLLLQIPDLASTFAENFKYSTEIFLFKVLGEKIDLGNEPNPFFKGTAATYLIIIRDCKFTGNQKLDEEIASNFTNWFVTTPKQKAFHIVYITFFDDCLIRKTCAVHPESIFKYLQNIQDPELEPYFVKHILGSYTEYLTLLKSDSPVCFDDKILTFLSNLCKNTLDLELYSLANNIFFKLKSMNGTKRKMDVKGPIINIKNKCGSCNKEDAHKKCGKCKSIYYCNQDCQKKHWKEHKVHCIEK